MGNFLSQYNEIIKFPQNKEISYLRARSLRIDILESVTLCTFMDTSIGVFTYCFPMKETPQT